MSEEEAQPCIAGSGHHLIEGQQAAVPLSVFNFALEKLFKQSSDTVSRITVYRAMSKK